MEEGRAYIETGVLEEYVAGVLSTQQQLEVEAMAAKYPEVKREIEAIEIALEKYALSHAVQPSPELKNRIFHHLDLQNNIGDSDKLKDTENNPAAPALNTITLNTNHYDTKIRTLRLALVACIALLLVSVVALFSTRNQLGEAKNEIIALNLDRQKFAAEASYLKDSNSDLQKISAMYDDPDWKKVRLAGTKMDPKAKMVVYWHVSGQHVMVDNSRMQLPANDTAHQYQLWALVNGKPVDLGVFDVKPDSNHVLLKMKEITGAQAFAVTLEKRGGSISPTMDQMIVMGGVSI